MKLEDPLNQSEIQITDVASARYALKTANDYHFAQIHLREQMEKELTRSAKETNAQILKILQLFLTEKVWTDHYGNYEMRPISYIPDPIPDEVPQWAKDAITNLRSQLELERERAEAELAENSEELLEMENYLEDKAGAWFKTQRGKGWLAGQNNVILGGCTMTNDGGEVSFEYKEQNYD